MSIFDTLNQYSADPNAGKANSFQLLPVGRYHFVIEKAEERPYIDGVARDNNAMTAFLEANPGVTAGRQVAFVLRVASGELAGRKLFFDATVIASSNQQTYGTFTPEAKVKAGMSDLAALKKRCKLTQVTAWTDFLAGEFMADVTHRKSKDGAKTYEQLNVRIKDGESLEVGAVSATSIPRPVDDPPF